MAYRSSNRPLRSCLLFALILAAFFISPRLSVSYVTRVVEASLPPGFHAALPPNALAVPTENLSTVTRGVAGFENALPSCRILDLPNDGLVKQYGHNNIRLSRSYEGSGTRIRRVLRKAASGQPIKIAVIGGSVSSGHGIAWPLDHTNYFPQRILHWFNTTFPGAEHTLNSDSILAGTTAHYFSFCVGETLPADVDLVLVELDVNQNDPTPAMLTATESLFRTLLEWPSNPAVMYLSSFALYFQDMTHGWRHSVMLTQWLDIPMINIRNFALPAVLEDESKVASFFTGFHGFIDVRHMAKDCHIALADMTIGYLREQSCLVQRADPLEEEPSSELWPGNEITEIVPRLGMLQRYDNTSVWPTMQPRCNTVASQKFPLVPIRGQGDWQLVEHNDKKSWEATTEGAEITFEVDPHEGLLGLIYWKTGDASFSDLRCWLDSEESYSTHRVLTGYIEGYGASKFDYGGDTWTGVPKGRHEMTCRIEKGDQGGTMFRLSAVVMR